MKIAVFILLAVSVGSLVVRYILNINSAAKALAAVYKEEGVDWGYWQDIEFRKKLFSSPETIVLKGDSIRIAEAKGRLVKCRSQMGQVLAIGVVLCLAGFALLILAGFADVYLAR